VIRAVIDTNVLVSGLLAPAGNEALIILAIHHGFLHPCCLEAILAEYAEVLARPKSGFAQDEIDTVLAMLREKGELIRQLAQALPCLMPMMESSCTARRPRGPSISSPATSGTSRRRFAAAFAS
jgi:PIN domain